MTTEEIHDMIQTTEVEQTVNTPTILRLLQLLDEINDHVARLETRRAE